MIEIKNFSISYDFELIKPSSCRFERNKYTALVGDSGIGKTSILKAIGFLYDGFEGSIIINGRSNDKKSINRENIAYCFQDSVIYPTMSIYDNILIGAKCKGIKCKYNNEEINALCNYLDLKFDLNQKGLNLSGGEKQKVNFLRAYILEPDILILDEPMSAMDRGSKIKVKKLLMELKKKSTIIHVSHDDFEYEGLVDKKMKIINKFLVS
jgi:ABC-type sugar transport system ATPase subunit